MQNYSIVADGVTDITPDNRAVTQRERTVITIEINDDTATITVGYVSQVDGTTFVPYPDGDITITGGAVFFHGLGVNLAVQVSGFGTETISLSTSVY